MRKVLATAFVSLDGVMQAPGGPEEDPTGGFQFGGWTANYWDDAIAQVMGGIFSVPYELLLGRKTYEIFAAHWPYAKDDPFAEALSNVRKYVATSSKAPLTWKNSIAIHDVPKDIARLKREDGPTLMTQGSSQLLQTLLKHDLVDRFTLLVYPVVLGKGKRLFGAGAIPAALKLVDSKASASGVTINSYERAGDVKVGSFALDQPSADELARRERMKREG
ncbi:MAG TPA: dihydrofolate reductase family protein [Steroidobacteraceae bacterium]|jgi:Dihydrofolate reductase|nr:dihydrofolate reductase family protein [Steroidobacteraceae bacterium]